MSSFQTSKISFSNWTLSILLLAPLFGLPSLAQTVPDDIDVEKYKKVYLQYKKVSEAKRQMANDLNQQVQNAAADIQQKENSIERGRIDIDKISETIRNTDWQSGQLTNEIEDFQQKIKKNHHFLRESEGRIEELENRNRSLQSELDRLGPDHQRALQKKDQVKVEFDHAAQEFDSQNRQMTTLMEQGRKIQGEIALKQKRANEVDTEINELKKFKENIDSIQEQIRREIQSLSTKIPEIQKDIGAVKAEGDQLRAEVAEIENQMADVAKRIASVQSAIQKARLEGNRALLEELRKERAALQQEKQSLDQKQTAAQQKVAANSARVSGLEKQKAQMESDIRVKTAQFEENKKKAANADPRLVDLQREKANLVQIITSLENDKMKNQTAIENQRPLVERAKSKKEEVGGRLAEAQEKLAAVSEKMQQVRRDISENNDRKEDIQRRNRFLFEENRDMKAAIDRDRNTIEQNDRDVQYYRQQINDIQAAIERDRADLERLDKRYVLLQEQYRGANSEAVSAEAETQSKFEKYKSVQTLYDRELRLAEKDGSAQGLPLGEAAGVEPGQRDGEKAGVSEGQSFGSQEGLLNGYLRGLIGGRDEGHSAGYEHGLNASGNYDKGYAIGYEQGKLNAKAIAKRENYYPARAQRKAQLLSAKLSQTVELDNGTARGGIATSVPMAFKNALKGESPSSGNLIPLASVTGDSWSDLVALIADVSREIERIPNEAVVNKDTGVVTFPIPVESGAAKCEQRYVDFVKACQAAFAKSYEDGFRSTYKTQFVASKKSAFAGAKPRAQAETENNRVQEGYNYAQPIAYSHWDQVGAQDAQNKGMAQGLKDGESQNISQERQTAAAQGLVDENQYFKTNPVLRLKSVSVRQAKGEKDIKAGDELLLSAEIGNYGFQNSQRGQAKVKWEAITPNVIVDSTLQSLVGIPSQTMATVNSIAYAKISPTAVLSETVKIEVTVYQPDGEVEKKTIEFKTKQHLITAVEANVDSQVKLGSGQQFVLVKVRNESDVNSPRDIQAKLSFGGYQGVDDNSGVQSFGFLGAGKGASQMFKYSLNRKAKVGDQFTVTVTVLFADQVSAQKSYTVKVKSAGSCDFGDGC